MDELKKKQDINTYSFYCILKLTYKYKQWCVDLCKKMTCSISFRCLYVKIAKFFSPCTQEVTGNVRIIDAILKIVIGGFSPSAMSTVSKIYFLALHRMFYET